MADHDEFCPVMYGEDGFWHCVCGVIAKARTDEQERIAQAIEVRAQRRYSWQRGGFRIAARIARQGGQR